jgi:uncharacterized membrane protein YccC
MEEYTTGVVAPAAPANPPARFKGPIGPMGDRFVAWLATFRPVWSKVAAFRALRATLVIPALFAFTSQVVKNPQIATFSAFGGFATLVLAGFGGTRRDKLVAHFGLACTGTVLIVIGTAVSTGPSAGSKAALAAAVTLVVAFCVLFAGITGPNAAVGATAAMLTYVLPAATPAAMSLVLSRLEGFWLASGIGTLAVLVLSPRPAGDRVRASAARSATALADQLEFALDDRCSPVLAEAATAANQALINAFTAAPYRPTGLAAPDQGLANLVETLEWLTTLVSEATREGTDLTAIDDIDQRLFRETVSVLRGAASLLSGTEVALQLEALEELRLASAARIASLDGDGDGADEVHVSFHAQIVATAARSAAVDVLIADRRVDPSVVATELARWRDGPGTPISSVKGPGPFNTASLNAARRLVTGHASLRSVWFVNSARGAVALAVAVGVADLTNVQHGFWVVLGALSVLRTNAASTGATALRALVGTSVGFFIGAALILGIGTHTAVLWVALPVALLIAAYAPGTAPFAVGQAAFTVMISVLYNIIVPVGWKVGEIRVEDVAIGAGVSALAGVLFWPRGASRVVGDDLADALHRGGVYLVQATAWALGVRAARPDAGASAVQAGARLDDALRASLAEQGTKKVPKEQLWRLVAGTTRLRLTAQSVAGPTRPEEEPGPAAPALVQEAVRLAGVCDSLASQLGHVPSTVAQELAGLPSAGGAEGAAVPSGYDLWVRQHLDHVRRDLTGLVGPTEVIAELRKRPWWR